MICDKCEGTGHFGFEVEIQEYNMRGMVHRIPTNKTYNTCEKCQGAGKVDWVENVVGKKPPKPVIDLDINSMYPSFQVSNKLMMETTPLHDDKIDMMAQALANKIDAEIMESLKGIWEQNDKYTKASKVLKDMGGTIFDN